MDLVTSIADSKYEFVDLDFVKKVKVRVFFVHSRPFP